MPKKVLIAGIVVTVLVVFGFMLYVDTTFCYENIFPPSEDFLRFPRCSDVFGVERLFVTIVNSFYNVITD